MQVTFTGSKLIVEPEVEWQSSWSLNFDVKSVLWTYL